MEKILAIIPARGGSKGIPRKNMALLDGKPLLLYTFEAAARSSLIDRIILSTDDEEFAAFAREHSIEPRMRPPELARDDTPMKEVIDYHLEELKGEGYEPDIFILLQPTSPLRTSAHIDEALGMLIGRQDADAIVSVIPVSHQFLPMKLMVKDAESGLLGFYKSGGEAYTTRQLLPRLYARNGAAIYAVYTEIYRRTGSLYGTRCLAYEMSREDSADIDEPFDLFEAETLLRYRRERLERTEGRDG